VKTPLDRLREVVGAALDAGETQGALAKRLKLTQPTISGWLTEDKLDPRASALEAVVRALGVNGHWLLTGEGDRYGASRGADVVYRTGVAARLHRAAAAIAATLSTEAVLDAADFDQAMRQVLVPKKSSKRSRAAPRPAPARKPAREA
jgi:transcriptional regulator with XRE-family HTH domain